MGIDLLGHCLLHLQTYAVGQSHLESGHQVLMYIHP